MPRWAENRYVPSGTSAAPVAPAGASVPNVPYGEGATETDAPEPTDPPEETPAPNETDAAMAHALETRAWELVVSDHNMPSFSAPEAFALVRNMNIALTPWAWEERIRQGELSALLLRPVHPFHVDLAGLAGLVAETGSALSHLAILARELEIPCVVGHAGARERFPSGTALMLDGTTGEVMAVEEENR